MFDFAIKHNFHVDQSPNILGLIGIEGKGAYESPPPPVRAVFKWVPYSGKKHVIVGQNHLDMQESWQELNSGKKDIHFQGWKLPEKIFSSKKNLSPLN